MMTQVVDKAMIEVHKKDRWCDLPTDLLRMIKDRLDFPNNLRFAAVCNSWQCASSTYTKDYKKSSSRDHPPWILITRQFTVTRREFISISTGEKYTINLFDFCCARTLSSKQGWLLTVALSSESKGFEDDSSLSTFFYPPIFLLNPFTRMRLELPSNGAKECTGPFANDAIRSGAFTVVQGMPDLVVIVTTAFKHLGVCPTIYVWTARPGDNEWKMHAYTRFQRRSFCVIIRVLMVGQLVYCFNESSGAIVLNLSNSTWTDHMAYVDGVRSEFYSSILDNKFDSYIVECEGEIYKCRFHKESGGRESMFDKLNTGCTAWEPLKDEDVKDKCWFLKSQFRGSFAFKEKWSDEVSSGYRKLEENGYSSSSSSIKVHLHRHPKTDATARKFLLDLTEDDSVEWVDMGC